MIITEFGLLHVGNQVVFAPLKHHKHIICIRIKVMLPDLIDVIAIFGTHIMERILFTKTSFIVERIFNQQIPFEFFVARAVSQITIHKETSAKIRRSRSAEAISCPFERITADKGVHRPKFDRAVRFPGLHIPVDQSAHDLFRPEKSRHGAQLCHHLLPRSG